MLSKYENEFDWFYLFTESCVMKAMCEIICATAQNERMLDGHCFVILHFSASFMRSQDLEFSIKDVLGSSLIV
jgi:hypothetical protein